MVAQASASGVRICKDQNPQAEARATKTRNLHKSCEDCGTRKFNPNMKTWPTRPKIGNESQFRLSAGSREEGEFDIPWDE
jgi:hypothetical protein